MKRNRKDGYTQEEIDYLRKIGYMTGRTNKEITEMFNKKFNQNRTVTAIIGAKSRHGIKSYTRVYTQEQLEYLKEITPGRTHKEITNMFNEKFKDNRTKDSIKSVLHEKGIKTGSRGWFEEGTVPKNTLPVGTEIGREDGYIYVKIKHPNIWKQKHHIIYEKEYGPIPKDQVVLFGDGNNRNFDINNLILISRSQLLGLNSINLIQNNAELTRTALTVVDIRSKINERKERGIKKHDKAYKCK